MQHARLRDVLAGTVLGVALQAALGAPFLRTYPQSYLSRAFEFSRVGGTACALPGCPPCACLVCGLPACLLAVAFLHATMLPALQPQLLPAHMLPLPLPLPPAQVFTFKWSVNWAFLPETAFTSPQLAMGLMFLHLRLLWSLAEKSW